jgi:hypothetical protein
MGLTDRPPVSGEPQPDSRTEPRTDAGKRAWIEFDDLGEYGSVKRLRAAILAIEAEAATAERERAERLVQGAVAVVTPWRESLSHDPGEGMLRKCLECGGVSAVIEHGEYRESRYAERPVVTHRDRCVAGAWLAALSDPIPTGGTSDE